MQHWIAIGNERHVNDLSLLDVAWSGAPNARKPLFDDADRVLEKGALPIAWCCMVCWSNCTKGCEGGVQAETRSLMTRPWNGAMSCAAVLKDRPCNTGSCDRDCTLRGGSRARWHAVAVSLSKRKVLVPIRGQADAPENYPGGA